LPYYYDRPGRVVTTVDDEAKKSTVMVNQPFVRDPHGRPQPAPAGVASPSPVKQYDLTKGVYGVSVTVGKSQASRLAAGSDGLGAILQSAPDTLPILGPIYLKYQDFPGHEQAAEALKRAFPQFHQGEDADADPTQLQAKLAHATQMLDQAKQEMDAMKQALETKQVEAQGKIAAVQAADQGQAQIEAMSQQFALKKLAMQADIDEMLAKLEGAIKLKLQDDQQQHLMAMAAAEAERADRGARASDHHEAVMGARSHEQHMVAGEVAHEQAETSAERQAERDATVTAAQGDGDDGA
jgi:MarR-like DNA-binding transcriptional regulator SgrR of sgrS sRNA